MDHKLLTVAVFLRGINVGGHHKVPMAELKKCLENTGHKNVRTLLNSGNIVFETNEKNYAKLETSLEQLLTKNFGFSIPVITRNVKEILALIKKNPFAGVEVHKDTRLYISFLKSAPQKKIPVPYISDDKAFQIIMVEGKNVVSCLDLSQTKTTKAMDDLEKLFGKNITTRNWNTVLKISAL